MSAPHTAPPKGTGEGVSGDGSQYLRASLRPTNLRVAFGYIKHVDELVVRCHSKVTTAGGIFQLIDR